MLAVDWWHVVKLAAVLCCLGVAVLLVAPYFIDPRKHGPGRVIRNAKNDIVSGSNQPYRRR